MSDMCFLESEDEDMFVIIRKPRSNLVIVEHVALFDPRIARLAAARVGVSAGRLMGPPSCCGHAFRRQVAVYSELSKSLAWLPARPPGQ